MTDTLAVSGSAPASVAATPFKVCIHRGTSQIGGTCVELAFGGERLLLDLGMPLDADPEGNPADLLPAVPGLRGAAPDLLGLVLSHGHADHWGLVPYVGTPLPAAMGAATRRMLHAAAPFVPRPVLFGVEAELPELADRRSVQIGPFRITPYLVDHSAYDAYALLVEAGGRRLFYTGDLRGHGRKGALFERLLRDPPRGVHAMLMEGSSLGRLDPDQRFPTEAEIEADLTERLRPPGFVAVCASAQNLDRVVSLYRACKRTGRMLVLDLYAAEVLAATGNPNIPRAGWDNVAIYVPEYQRRHVIRRALFDVINDYKPHRIYPEHLAALAPLAAMLFRPAMVPDIDALGTAWAGARAIWSQWDGYLKDGSGARLAADLKQRSVPLEVIHTSGHASIADLRRLAQAVAPEALIPVHSFEGDRYASLFGPAAVRRADGEWWEV
jgi:ribonuclease J